MFHIDFEAFNCLSPKVKDNKKSSRFEKYDFFVSENAIFFKIALILKKTNFLTNINPKEENSQALIAEQRDKNSFMSDSNESKAERLDLVANNCQAAKT